MTTVLLRIKNWIHRQLLEVTVSLSKFVSQIHAPFTRQHLTSIDYRLIRSFKQKGIVLVARQEGEMSNLFIPDFWSHVAIYDGEETVIEATTHGVKKTDILDFVMAKDFIAAFMPTFCDSNTRAIAWNVAEGFIGSPYDFSFAAGNRAFYCSELLYEAFNQAMEGKSPVKMRELLGVQTVTPEDFANPELFLCLMDTRSDPV